MGEKTGFMTVLIIFAIGVIPFLFSMFDTQVKSSKLLALSSEVNQLMVAEGDITPTVNNVVSNFEAKGVVIEFRDKNDNIITSSPGIGEKIVVVYKIDDFEVSNSVIVNKR